MKVFRSEHGFLLRLHKGEEIHEALREAARERGLRGGVVSGVGAVEGSVLGYYHLDRREYERREEPGIAELLSLAGNLSRKDGDPFLHAHAVLMRRDFSLAGGHLFRAVTAVTVELAVTLPDLDLIRLPDREMGLPLLEAGP